MKTHEYAVVTEATLKTYRNSGFEAGNIFHIQSRTECKDGITHINLIVGNEGHIKGYQERFFDVKAAYEPTAEEIKAKSLETTLKDLLMRIWESDPSARTQIQESVQGAPTYHEEHAEMMAQHLVEFVENNCGDALLKLADWAQPFEEPEEVEV